MGISNYSGTLDKITIESIDGRKVSGVRIYNGSDNINREYDLVGFFDGLLLSLTATSKDQRETRTLAIVMKRDSGNKFTGRRTFLDDTNEIVSNSNREWVRSI